MSLARYAKRRDDNEKPIVDGLTALGFEVERLDVCDLIVRRRSWPPDKLRLLEVKSARGSLTPRQKLFRLRFPVAVVRSLDEALEALLR
jgi:hypothetical protein